MPECIGLPAIVPMEVFGSALPVLTDALLMQPELPLDIGLKLLGREGPLRDAYDLALALNGDWLLAGHCLFQGLKQRRSSTFGQTPVNRIPRSSIVKNAGGLDTGHSIS